MITRRKLAVLAASAAFAPCAAWAFQAAPKPPTLEELIADEVVVDCAISPDGKTVAVLRKVRQGAVFVFELTLHPFDDLDKAQRIKLAQPITTIGWVSNDRLACIESARMSFGFVSAGVTISLLMGVAFVHRGTLKVERLSDNPEMKRRGYRFMGMLTHLPGERVLMQLQNGSPGPRNVYEVNLVTGAITLVERGQLNTVSWTVQDGQPVMRTDLNGTGRIASLYGRSEGKWSLIRRIHQQSLVSPDFDVVGSAQEPGMLLVAATAENDGFRGLHRFDMKTMNWAGPVSRREGRDVAGAVSDKYGRYLGAAYFEDRIAYDFADKTLTDHFRELNAAFENSCNVILKDICEDRSRLVAYVEGPKEAGCWVVFDRKAGAVGFVGNARPWLTAERLAPMHEADVVSRDGSRFRAYLSVPLAKGPRPMVVLPHGGPEARDVAGFNVMAQALAAQGWVVLQPNFRGSGGYGKAFAEAGHRRWNGRIMEDIEDAVDQVARSGLVDKKRIAIMGLSFGGYAALMQAVRKPDQYCAVISAAGVSDPGKMLQMFRQEGEDSPEYQFWIKRIGDPRTDNAAIDQAAPIRRVAEIKAPVLLFHGRQDDTVPVVQSQDMAAALKRAGKPCEYIEMSGMGHSGWPDRVLGAFLARSIGFLQEQFDKA